MDDILKLYDQQERRDGTHPSYRREELPNLVRYVSRDPQRLSFVVFSQLSAANADQIIAEQIDYFNQIGSIGFEWKAYGHDEPSHLQQRLLAHGFEKDEVEALLVMDLEQAPALYFEPVTADVRAIDDPEQLQDVVTVQEQVYDSDFTWLAKQLAENMRTEPDYWRIYVAYVLDEPACAAWAAFSPGSQFAGLWGGSTVPVHRKQGLYTAVVAARAQEARRRGYRYLTVDASPMSWPILEKQGFRFLVHTYPFTVSFATESKTINKSE